MSVQLQVTDDPRLTVLADEISREYRRAEDKWKETLSYAITVGGLLMQAKDLLSHGEWGSWLDQHFPGSHRTAQRWMQFAENGHVSDLPSQRAAIASLTEPKTPAVVDDDDIDRAERAIKRLGNLTKPADQCLRSMRRALITEDPDAAAHAIGLWREFQILDELIRIRDRGAR